MSQGGRIVAGEEAEEDEEEIKVEEKPKPSPKTTRVSPL